MLRNFTRSTRLFSTRSILAKDHGETNLSPKIITQKTPDGKDEKVVKIAPIERGNEDINKKKARLIYQSRKRGILETDLLLSKFAKLYLDKFSLEELDEYDKLLDELDWDIYYWATKNYDITPLPKKWENSKILKLLQELSENKEREVLRMPNLY
ncbi:hypothetical protein BN7_4514 [Wickerhamomyces ciferrii]|uniref:Succinate dehydrogenase assembly factor 2, mitochondrial n=1 Tax=Wickerhamomyces ciferrii (strain ATCC 14091 / BCRC 22168 / CBS 111 / JCM 3599 / NBRC 0793 / NRRL Y-1031 F-60-10) TaxID=1206466 RepID=K0KU51_WICCF|nr:uncharacterized protein BN7_4514 [Wickerhamomyces ciferrii]CCH44944.1 hypothetical protein BN7_4514 [Wickerhamomyces ciferrii]